MFLPLGNIKNKFKFEKAILKPASLCVPGSCLFTARFLRDVIKHLNNLSEALEEGADHHGVLAQQPGREESRGER